MCELGNGRILGSTMSSALIIVFCTGQLIYWISRTKLLLHGSEDQIWRTLESDLARGRRLLMGLKSLVPSHVAG